MSYAVVKCERSTGEIEVVISRGMQFNHADTLAASIARGVQEGFYIKAVNENEERVQRFLQKEHA